MTVGELVDLLLEFGRDTEVTVFDNEWNDEVEPHVWLSPEPFCGNHRAIIGPEYHEGRGT